MSTKYRNTSPAFYALLKWGGSQPGNRPATALFKVYKEEMPGPFNTALHTRQIKAVKIDPKTGRELTKLNTYHGRDIVCHWFRLPTPAEVRKVKQSMRAV